MLQNTITPLPQVSQVELSQSVTFEEKIGPEEGVWNSKSLILLDNKWSFRFVKKPGAVDFRIKFEGPDDSCTLEQAIIVIGKRATDEHDSATTGSVVEVIKNIKFGKLEARVIRDMCQAKTFASCISDQGILCFTVKFVQTSVGLRKNSKSPEKSKKYSAMQDKLAELTRERNTLHKSLQKMSLTDNDVSYLNESTATQPEVTRQFEGFKQASKALIFTILGEKSHAEFGTIMSNYVGRIVRRVRSKRQEKLDRMLEVLGVSTATDQTGTVTIAENALKQIVRSTAHENLNRLSDVDLEELREIAASTELRNLDDLDLLIDFGKFVWNLTIYTYGNEAVFVNWDSFGKLVKFKRGKYESISRRVRAGEECYLVVPVLQRRPFGQGKKVNEEDFEALSAGLVIPV